MGRRARHSREKIAEAALALAAEGGPRAATIGAIAERLGAPTGSIYHRFGSRDALFAELWLSCVEAYQQGLLAALGGDVCSAAIDAALHSVRWVRAHPVEARFLLLYRREDFVEGPWPEELAARAKRLNDAVLQAIANYARRRFGSADARRVNQVSFVVIDLPYGALKRWVQVGTAPPPEVDEMIRTAAAAVLAE